MTLALLAMAQSVIVISGGIDLSVGAMMVLANCIAARLMLDQDLGTGRPGRRSWSWPSPWCCPA